MGMVGTSRWGWRPAQAAAALSEKKRIAMRMALAGAAVNRHKEKAPALARGGPTLGLRTKLRVRPRRYWMPPACLQTKMVLPVRIELTTSALPRMRSTTELRQHVALYRERGAMAALPI